MAVRRSLTYKKFWNKLIEMYGATCYYCQEEMATTIDHVVPQSWDNDNSIENLVPACALCNSIAGDKVFNNINEKKTYILNKRKNKKLRRAICVECLLPFEYRVMSPSLFLCAECYDLENHSSYSDKTIWKKWIESLRDAGIYPEAHRYARKQIGRANKKGKRHHKNFVKKIAEWYINNLHNVEN